MNKLRFITTNYRNSFSARNIAGSVSHTLSEASVVIRIHKPNRSKSYFLGERGRVGDLDILRNDLNIAGTLNACIVYILKSS